MNKIYQIPLSDKGFIVCIYKFCYFVAHSRHHTYKKGDKKSIELTEVGPRFEMKCKLSRNEIFKLLHNLQSRLVELLPKSY